MKYIISIFLIFLWATGIAGATSPEFEISPLVGYHLGGSGNYSEGSVDVKDSVSYGLVLSYVDHPRGFSLDFTYTRADGWLYFTAIEAG